MCVTEGSAKKKGGCDKKLLTKGQETLRRSSEQGAVLERLSTCMYIEKRGSGSRRKRCQQRSDKGKKIKSFAESEIGRAHV